MTRANWVVSLSFGLLLSVHPAAAQKGAQNQPGGSPGGGQGGQQPSGGGSSLQGVSWARSTWDQDLGMPLIANQVVACYRLIPGNSATQPFVLQEARTDAQRQTFLNACHSKSDGSLDEKNPFVAQQCRTARENLIVKETADLNGLKAVINSKPSDVDKLKKAQTQEADESKSLESLKKGSFQDVKWQPCTTLDSVHPLLMDQTLVIGIDMSKIPTDRMKVLNLNLTNQQGNPINPTPVRASFGGSGASPTANLDKGGPYYLVWPNQIPGDTISTVNVNIIYTPPAPGDRWLPNTLYPAGSVVTAPSNDGHFYTARTGGISQTDNGPAFGTSTPAIVIDGTVVWIDSGSTAPQSGGGAAGGTPPGLWMPTTSYNRGQAVFDPYNGHYFTASAFTTATTCPLQGGATTPCGMTGLPPTDPFSLPTITDSTVAWADMGTAPPCSSPPCAGVNDRLKKSPYAQGAWVDPKNGHYYQAVQSGTGTTADGPFSFPVSAAPASVSDGSLIWQDQGVNAPAGAAPNPWSTFQKYLKEAFVIGSDAHYYQVAGYTGTTGTLSGPVSSQPYFPVTAINTPTSEAAAGTLPIVWVDNGTTAPGSVASGQPGDTTVSALNLQFAQSHSYSYYNLASGVVYSYIRNRSYGLTCNPPPLAAGVTANCQPPGTNSPNTGIIGATQTSSNPTIDPVLLFTIYPKPIDSETRCGAKCIVKTWPGFSFGLSLANPSSTFYAGFSFELLRNLQLVGGYSMAKTTQLPPAGTPQPTSLFGNSGAANPAVTVQNYAHEPFWGLTLNISGFIQSLFGGGGGGGGGKGGGGSSPASSSGSSATQ